MNIDPLLQKFHPEQLQKVLSVPQGLVGTIGAMESWRLQTCVD
jgi:hypothetical protein